MESITLIIRTCGCEATRKQSKFECYRLFSSVDLRIVRHRGK